ncbi:MAG: outer membrane beta-barrel domain-containing protein [Gammaproteobacteria bacterium]|nr:outer membrane beta-barrel domain-containing protein [Gammaproteobacteria bacterium]
MATWLQRILLILLLSISSQQLSANEEADLSELDSEQFEVGIVTGFITVQDFSSEMLWGIQSTFHSTENVFLQANYFQADVGLSSFEQSQGALFSGDDRNFKHLDFLIGYNIFQAEQFFSGTQALLSSLYLVAGVGDTQFGGEQSFTTTVGLGYRVDFTRTTVLRVDYRAHLFDSSLLQEDDSTANSQFSVSLSYLF